MQNAAQAEAAKQQSSNPGAAGRRRVSSTLHLLVRPSKLTTVSQSSDVKFSGLSGYKRSSMDDKRTSYADQDRNAGVLGQMWNNFTKGTGNQGTGNK